MEQQNQNQILEKTAAEVLNTVPPDLKNTTQRIVLAGKKVMYSDQTHDLMIEQLKEPGEPAVVAGQGMAKLFSLLLQQSQPNEKSAPTLDMNAAFPAMQILLCEGLGFMEEAGIAQVTPELLATATQTMIASMLQMLGITPEKMQEMSAQRAQQGGMDAGALGGQPSGAAPTAGAQPPGGGLIDSAMGG